MLISFGDFIVVAVAAARQGGSLICPFGSLISLLLLLLLLLQVLVQLRMIVLCKIEYKKVRFQPQPQPQPMKYFQRDFYVDFGNLNLHMIASTP
ncbi:MAG: hypothetical protein ACX933_18070 [Marinobacter adhaerens]